MGMKIGLQLQQKQSLIMTQRLQQALKLLQVPTLELQQILQQERAIPVRPLDVVDHDHLCERCAAAVRAPDRVPGGARAAAAA